MVKVNFKDNKKFDGLEDEYAFEDKIKKHQNILYSLGGGLLVAGGAFFGYKKFEERNSEKLQNEIFSAVFALEEGNYTDAIEGNDDFSGFKAVALKYKNAKEINLVNYYLGVASMKSQKFDDAIEAFQKINFKDLVMQTMAYGLIGDCFMEKKDFDSAILFYEKAINKNSNPHTTPMFMVKAAVAAEEKGDVEQALRLYKDIANKFRNYEPSTIQKHIARLE